VVVIVLSGIVAGVLQLAHAGDDVRLYAGADRENVTPFTRAGDALSNPDGLPCDAACATDDVFKVMSAFEGTITHNGVWGERYTDSNGNGRYDAPAAHSRGEPFTDDPKNTQLDRSSARKWDGIYLAGFGRDRAATGVMDPIWVRAAVFAESLADTDLDRYAASYESVALVSLDVFGYFSDWTDRIMEQARSLWYRVPQRDTYEFFLDRIILSSTTNHSGPDVHLGMWGPNARTDGTYPLYERYLERKIAVAIVRSMLRAASQARVGSSTKVRAGALRGIDTFTTERGNHETLQGLQARTACRTPWFFDDEMRAFQAVDDATGKTIVSMINWGARDESLGRRNTLISPDFAGYARDQLESRIGGVALWTPGAQGAVEIVGDTCTRRWARETFDGETFRRTDQAIQLGRPRTRAIGRLLGDAAFAALSGAAIDERPNLGHVDARELYVHVTNQGIGALAAAGVIDKPGYVPGEVSVDAASQSATDNYADGPEAPSPGVDAHTTLYAFRIGPASFVSIPGELFPELYYGVETYNRSNELAYDTLPLQRYLACSADARRQGGAGPERKGRPYEPGIRQEQIARFDGANVHFALGATPDMLGPIVPGYDYSIYGLPAGSGLGVPVEPGAGAGAAAEAPDECASQPVARQFAVTSRTHYHETISPSSMLAPAFVCTLGDVLRPEINWPGQFGACAEWDRWRVAGIHDPLYRSRTEISLSDPERIRIRHY
jgi:hypothetical protein